MGDLGSIPGLERSSGESKGCPLQDSNMQNPMDYIVHGVAESDMTERLSLSKDIVTLYIYIYIYIHTHTHTYIYIYVPICMNKASVQFSLSVVSDSF